MFHFLEKVIPKFLSLLGHSIDMHSVSFADLDEGKSIIIHNVEEYFTRSFESLCSILFFLEHTWQHFKRQLHAGHIQALLF